MISVPSCLTLRALLIPLFLASIVPAADTPAPLLRFSEEIVPPGGTAQIKIWAISPSAITGGRIILDLDPSIFGPIASATVFGATGEALGAATVDATHLDISYSSETGGIGRTADLPILAITVPVLATATPGAVVQITTASVPAQPGTFRVGGTMWIADVVPGGGILAAGDVVKIFGNGFTPQSTVDILSVNVASVRFVSAQEIDVTMGGPIEITGKRVRVRNPDGSQVDFYPSMRGPFVNVRGETVHPTLALRPFSWAFAVDIHHGAFPRALVFQNQTAAPVSAFISALNFDYVEDSRTNLTIQPGSTVYRSAVSSDLNVRPGDHGRMVASSPIRMGVFREPIPGSPSNPVALQTSTPSLINFSAGFHSFTVAAGSNPAPEMMAVQSHNGGFPFSVSAATNSGGDWLSVSPAQGTACSVLEPLCTTVLTVSVNSASLAPGLYAGTINVTPLEKDAISQPGLVRLEVKGTPAPSLAVFPPSFSGSGELEVSTTAAPAEIRIQTATSEGGPWLSVTPLEGGKSFNVVATTAGLDVGTYRGTISITAAGKTVIVPVTITIPNPYLVAPAIGAVVNAASQLQGPIVPGEILTIFGIETGPVKPVASTLTTATPTSLAATRVLFDGVPAQIFYASGSQLNVVVPAGVSAPSSTIAIEYGGGRSAAWSVPVGSSAPAIFTNSGTGVGQGAVLNQDNTINSPSNAAAPGSVIQVFGTGQGSVSGDTHATIGGRDAQILYTGNAGGGVPGLLQINARVPADVAAGDTVPILLTIGGVRSADGVTIAVR